MPAASNHTVPAPHFVVKISKSGIAPEELIVPINSTVVFEKQPNEDPSLKYEIKFDSEKSIGIVESNQPLSRSFSKPGRFEYHCQRYLVLRGRIIVEGQQSLDQRKDRGRAGLCRFLRKTWE